MQSCYLYVRKLLVLLSTCLPIHGVEKFMNSHIYGARGILVLVYSSKGPVRIKKGEFKGESGSDL